MTDLKTIATAVRAFLEPIWLEWHAASGELPNIISRGTCGRSSLFLQKVLSEDFGLSTIWISGAPGTSGGYLINGQLEGHAWVISRNTLIDITADQFGADTVLIAPWPHPLYQAGEDGFSRVSPEAHRDRQRLVAIMAGV